MAEKKEKKEFDPSTLPPEMQQVYAAMRKEFDAKLADMEKVKAESLKKAEELQKSVEYYERLLPELYAQLNQQPREASASQSVPQAAPVEANEGEWNPFDPSSVRSVVRSELANYHKMLEGAYQQLVNGIVQMNAWNQQLTQLQLQPIAQKVGVELPDINKVIQEAPRYGGNLEMAYRALYESPKVYQKSQEYDKMVQDYEKLKQRLKDLEARTMPGVLGGTTGPIPRTVAMGKKPQTYEEVAASIPANELFTSESAGTGGSAVQ